MAKPRIFISSTHFDLKHIRASLETFIQSLGYEPILSESGNIPYTPDVPLDESCYREVGNSDIYVLILGGRYGAEVSANRSDDPKGFYDFYESITRREYEAAVAVGIPIYVLVDRPVYSELQTYRKNRENDHVRYAHVDSVNTFRFIEEILSLPRNNPVEQFDRYADIERWLKEQWSGYFRELLHQRSNREQIRSLATQVNTLGTQVEMLSEVNETLKRYLEQVISKVSPEESASLIESEADRLNDAIQAKLEETFPNLSKSNYQIIGPASNEYNSVALAAGDNSKWWAPSRHWPDDLPKDSSLSSFVSLYAALGFQPCATAEFEPGIEKIALYQKQNGDIGHVAKQIESGKWLSKLGRNELINHDNLDALTGEVYGRVVQILCRNSTKQTRVNT